MTQTEGCARGSRTCAVCAIPGPVDDTTMEFGVLLLGQWTASTVHSNAYEKLLESEATSAIAAFRRRAVGSCRLCLSAANDSPGQKPREGK